MQVKIKILRPEAQIPQYGRVGDAGMDLFACEDQEIAPGMRAQVPIGIAIEIPDGTVALVWDRGGMAAKNGVHSMAGVIDSNYRGEVQIILYNTTDQPYQIKRGDKVAQMLIQKHEVVDFKQVNELADSERGEGAWLSSGR